jgi:hypothetical protein
VGLPPCSIASHWLPINGESTRTLGRYNNVYRSESQSDYG